MAHFLFFLFYILFPCNQIIVFFATDHRVTAATLLAFHFLHVRFFLSFSLLLFATRRNQILLTTRATKLLLLFSYSGTREL